MQPLVSGVDEPCFCSQCRRAGLAALVGAGARCTLVVLGCCGVGNGGCGSKSEPVAEGIIAEQVYTSVSFLNYGLAFSSWVLCSSRTRWEHFDDLGKEAV